MGKGLLRYKVDAFSILAVTITLLLQVVAVVGHWPWYTLPLILVLIRHVSLVEHNHAHLTVFRSGILNEFLGWLCFLSNGIPLEFYRIHHVSNHHRYNQRFDGEEKDWSSTFGFKGARYPDRPIGKSYYIVTFPVITIASCLIYLLRSPRSKQLRCFVASISVVTSAVLLLSLINWQGVFLFFLIPWLIVIFAHGFNNYNQHQGCNMIDPFNSANENLSIRGRVLWLNIGYHIEHHMKPNLHWSKLPAYHRRVHSLIPPERLSRRGHAGVKVEPRESVQAP